MRFCDADAVQRAASHLLKVRHTNRAVHR